MSRVPGSRFQVSGRDLPRLCLIADGFVGGSRGLTGEEIRQRTSALVRAGVPWVQLRDHNATTEAFEEEARRLGKALRATNPSLVISLNGHTELAREIGAGVHVGRCGPAVEEVVSEGLFPFGYSTHSIEEVRRAEGAGADYVSFSPVFSTRSHPDARPQGLDALREVARKCRLPVFALGGITTEQVRVVRDAGAYGVSVVSALLLADDAERAVGAIRLALREA